ncbi:MAG: NAD(P)-dependent oxidoreductase [Phycisphaerales bacterium]
MNKPLVLITEPITHDAHDWLAKHCDTQTRSPDSDDFLPILRNAHALVVRTYTQVDQTLLENAPNLKVIGRAGVGLDNIDLQACSSRGIQVVHTPRANAMAVVEYTISMLMQSLRPINQIKSSEDIEQWHSAREAAITPDSVVDTTIGIIGMGYIGSRVARVASALGMRVRYNDLTEITPECRHGAESVSLDELLKTSRCICIHVDGRASNHKLIDQDRFNQMLSNVVLMNASRGFVIDHHAAELFAATNLSAKLILDVHDPEPPSPHSTMLSLPNITLTPHVAAATSQAKTAMSSVVQDIWAVLNDQKPKHPANNF